MQRRRFLAMLACTVSGLPALAQASGHSSAQDGLAVPAYAPAPGERSSWRIEVEGSQMRGGLAEPFNVRRAATLQHLTVLGKTPFGFSMLWEMEKPPAEQQGNLPSVLMDLYGVSQLAIGADFSGAPQQMFGREAYRQAANEKLVAAGPGARDNVQFLQIVLNDTRDNPFFDMQTLTPAATLISRAQRASPWQAVAGESAVVRQSDDAWGVPVTGDVTVRIESADSATRTVALAWDWDIPVAALSPATQREIETMIANNKQMAAVLPAPLRADATSSAHHFSGHAMISADDGATLAVEEKRTLRIGLESTITVLRATRLTG